MKIAIILTLAAVVLAKNHHHSHSEAIVRDIAIDDNDTDDLYVSQKEWNPDTLKLVRSLEGLRLNAFEDINKEWTIGYGHTGPEVYSGLVITQ